MRSWWTIRIIIRIRNDASELDDKWFQAAELRDGNTVIERGRPKSVAPSVALSLRVPPGALDQWKSTGPVWQTRMMASLKTHAPKRRHA